MGLGPYRLVAMEALLPEGAAMCIALDDMPQSLPPNLPRFDRPLVLIGLMGEFYTRRHASASWSAGH